MHFQVCECIFGCLSASESSSVPIVFPPHCSPALEGRRAGSYFLIHLHDYQDDRNEEEHIGENPVEEEDKIDCARHCINQCIEVGDHKYIF